jgi:hypothetical protein
MYKLFLAMVFCFVSACATTGKYEESLNSWKGASDTSLMATWGMPAETFDSKDHRFLVYQFSRTRPLVTMGDRTGSKATYMQALFCTTVFGIVGGHVEDWAIKGNDCKNANRPILWKTEF